ncbi:M23 family metallopeptidase [Microbacterium sp. NPDC089987]|uniref:M23 family metallopeptidase n=1 Tax=Microbacterium sp. NPDC089987 TaxID=3364202 RepID=UPI003828B842
MPRSLDLAFPFAGQWLVQNSPANRVPSHGTPLFASSYAIDFVPLGDHARTAPMRARSWVRTEPAQVFPGYGRGVLAPADGIVVAAEDAAPDHGAHRGLPSVGYAVSQRRRAAQGWAALSGNHVLLHIGDAVVALCHLQQHSLRVRVGEAVVAGQPLAGCGNSGNSTEPHLHLQAIDRPDVGLARAVPVTFSGALPRNGSVVSA